MSAVALRAAAPLEGEVLGPGDGADLVVSPSAFKKGEARVVHLPPGASLEDAVLASGLGPNLRRHLGVYLNEHRIDRALWPRIRPKPGTVVYIRVELAGGDSGGKNPLRALMMLAVSVIAIWAGPIIAGSNIITASLFGNAVVTAALMTAGQMLVNALIPPPKTKNQWSFDQQPGNPYASLTGIRNVYPTPGTPIPRVIGKRRIYPLLAARPYTESQGKTQYIRMLLLCGYGPLDISELRIGNTPISAFEGSSYEIRQGWTAETGALKAGGPVSADAPITLYTKSIVETPLSTTLIYDTPETQFSEADATELSIDITFPFGLVNIDAKDGRRKTHSCAFTVRWRADGAGSWNNAAWIDGSSEFGTQTAGQLTATAAKASPEIRSGRFPVSGGTTYEVEIKRTTATSTDDHIIDNSVWTVLRSIKPSSPINMPGLTLIALRLKATEQLNGAPDTINCIAHSYLPTTDDDGATWEYSLSRSPGFGALDLLRRRGTSAMIADSRIDLASFIEFADACAGDAPNAEEPYWQCDAVLEGGAVVTAAQLIAATGRGQLSLVDGKYAIVRDVAQTTPVQHITPRNSWGYRGAKAFAELPHAFQVSFINPAVGYTQDEIIVYRDGYGEDAGEGVIEATKFEGLQLLTCCSVSQAWREGRYHLKVLEARAEEHSVSLDIEHVRCVKGSLVRFAHDVISVGQSSGRVVFAEVNEADEVVALVLDNKVSMESGGSYGIRIRHCDFSSTVHPVVFNAGEGLERIALVSPVALDDWPLPSGQSAPGGELFTFGEADEETIACVVKEIKPGPNQSARIVMVDAAPEVHTTDQGELPGWITTISESTPPSQQKPQAPVIDVRSDESVRYRSADGSLIDRMCVTHNPPATGSVEVTRWEVGSRSHGTNEPWTESQNQPVNTPIYIEPVVRGETYDVRARFISKDGVPSDWTIETEHVVVGQTTRPTKPTNIVAKATLDGLYIEFDAPPDSPDIAGYEFRMDGSDWDDATFLTRAGHIRDDNGKHRVLVTTQLSGGETVRAKTITKVEDAALWSDEETATVTGRTNALDGVVNDWRGIITNGLGGAGVARSGASIAGGGATGINVNAVTLYVTKDGLPDTESLPSATISGLSTTTKYWVAYDFQAADYDYTDTFATAAAWMNDATGRYFYVGSRTTGGGSFDNTGSGETP